MSLAKRSFGARFGMAAATRNVYSFACCLGARPKVYEDIERGVAGAVGIVMGKDIRRGK